MTPTAYLTLYLSPTSEPVLTSDELDAILELAAIPDKNGLPTDDSNWTPTYNLNFAVAEGWKIKACKASGNYDFADDTLSLKRSQIAANCMTMADQWAKKGGSSAVGGGYITSVNVINSLIRRIGE